MRDLLVSEFQDTVDRYLVRHKSMLDILTKAQEASARINRAVVKAVTSCGCVRINAGPQRVPEDITLQELKDHMATHLEGTMCESCRDVVEQEVGQNLFYLAALCNALDLSLYDILIKEGKKLSALGPYNVT